MGNIEFPYEVDHCVERGADGIGLYRTEFLYLSADVEPTEETHFEAYSRVIKAMGKKPVVIRTLDLGADKLAQMPIAVRKNEIRCWDCEAFACRCATCRCFARSCGQFCEPVPWAMCGVMFPLITTLMELRQARMVLTDVMEDLDENKIPFNRRDIRSA